MEEIGNLIYPLILITISMELLNRLIGFLSLCKGAVVSDPILSLGVFVAISTVLSAYLILHRELRMAKYKYLADIWYKIKDDEFKNLDFVDANKTSAYNTCFTGDRLMQYNVFASKCWAHAEDIYLNKWHRKRWLWDSCYTQTIRRYKKRHYKWLMEHRRDFDQHFEKYIKKLDLFSIDAKKIKEELNKLGLKNKELVSAALKSTLKDEFKNGEFSLDKATITRVKKKEWEITTVLENPQKTLNYPERGVTSSIKFIVRKKYGKLKIYNEFKDKK